MLEFVEAFSGSEILKQFLDIILCGLLKNYCQVKQLQPNGSAWSTPQLASAFGNLDQSV